MNRNVQEDPTTIFLEALAPVHHGKSIKKISHHYNGYTRLSKLKSQNQKCEKMALSGQKTAKPKIFKNPPKIQFWSDCKMPIVKNYQNIKSFQMY